MAHAHTQTLLAQMGFTDTDRKDPLHDLACQYLAQPEVAKRVLDHVFTPPANVQAAHSHCIDLGLDAEVQELRDGDWWRRGYKDVRRASLVEAGILDGDGRLTDLGRAVVAIPRPMARRTVTDTEVYVGSARAVGFLDVVIATWPEYGFGLSYAPDYVLAVEVKAGEVRVSDVQRQLALLKAHWGTWRGVSLYAPPQPARIRWALATCDRLPGRDVDALRQSGVDHFRLDEQRVRTWAAGRDVQHESPLF